MWRSVLWICSPNVWPRSWDPNVSALMSSSKFTIIVIITHRTYTVIRYCILIYYSPGPVRTEFLSAMGMPDEVSDKMHDGFGSIIPVGRSGLSTDIADSILYLASDHAAFVTGTNLVSDGGQIAANALNIEFLKDLL